MPLVDVFVYHMVKNIPFLDFFKPGYTIPKKDMSMKAAHAAKYVVFREMLINEGEAQGLTQKEIASSLNVQRSFVSKSKNGECRPDVIEFIPVAKKHWARPCEGFKTSQSAYPPRQNVKVGKTMFPL